MNQVAHPDQPVTTGMLWDSQTSIANNGTLVLDERCLAELNAVAHELARNPHPVTMLHSKDFHLPNCQAFCTNARHILNEGVGFVVIEHLPLDTVDHDAAIKLYWLLTSMVGRPVAQKWNGEMIYDVTDTGRKATAGSGVRSSKTNGGQVYHTDNSFNLPPSFVSLLCLQPAIEGGESGLISFDSVYNRLLENYPDVLPRLFQPFYFDRQREHAPDDSLFSNKPVFELLRDHVQVRLATNLIRQGYAVANKEIDAVTEDALKALDDVMESDDLGRRFDFQPGQIQIVNNRRIGHRRTAFVDSPDPELKRHLVRIWLRDHERPFYAG